MSLHAAVVEISADLLIACLRLPGEVEILYGGYCPHRNSLILTVEHSDLPEVWPGHAIPSVAPQFELRNRRLPGEGPEPIFVGWSRQDN